MGIEQRGLGWYRVTIKLESIEVSVFPEVVLKAVAAARRGCANTGTGLAGLQTDLYNRVMSMSNLFRSR